MSHDRKTEKGINILMGIIILESKNEFIFGIERADIYRKDQR